jgi:ArsR family transcriptional regulator
MATNNLRRLCEILQTMSNPSRLRILEILHAKGETCVCELEAALGLTQSNISFHLNLLRKTGLVTSQKVGKWVFYTLETEAMKGCLEKLTGLFAVDRAQKRRRRSSVFARCQTEELSRAKILESSCCSSDWV